MNSKKNPIVSVVLCTYNGAAFLSQQLDTLLSQTYPHLQIIISDDASSDNTLDIIKSYIKRDQRIKLFTNEQTLGYNQNFEKAFSHATGEFIAVCDQDDLWKPEKIERMLSLFVDSSVLLVHSQSVRFTTSVPEIEVYNARKYFEGSDVRRLMFFNTIAGHNIIFRKSLLENALPFPASVFYDWWLVIIAAIYGKVAGSNRVYTFHRSHHQNVTLGKKDEKRQTKAKAKERLLTLKYILQISRLKPEHKQFGENLYKGLANLQEKYFSFQLFYFLLQHADTVFFFKKRSFFSHLKIAYRLSFAI